MYVPYFRRRCRKMNDWLFAHSHMHTRERVKRCQRVAALKTQRSTHTQLLLRLLILFTMGRKYERKNRREFDCAMSHIYIYHAYMFIHDDKKWDVRV